MAKHFGNPDQDRKLFKPWLIGGVGLALTIVIWAVLLSFLLEVDFTLSQKEQTQALWDIAVFGVVVLACWTGLCGLGYLFRKQEFALWIPVIPAAFFVCFVTAFVLGLIN